VEIPQFEEEDYESDDDIPNTNEEIFHCETVNIPSFNKCLVISPLQECSKQDSNSMLSPYHYPSQQMVNEMADKLDVMITVVYEYLHRITDANSDG